MSSTLSLSLSVYTLCRALHSDEFIRAILLSVAIFFLLFREMQRERGVRDSGMKEARFFRPRWMITQKAFMVHGVVVFCDGYEERTGYRESVLSARIVSPLEITYCFVLWMCIE